MTELNDKPTLPAIFLRFLRFGAFAWGGPIAQIGMIKRELVDQERWLPPDRFNRLLAVYQILPGPEAHELCVHLGMMKRGRLGGMLAGLGFMLPGLLLILILAWAYRQVDLANPYLASGFLGAQVGVIALIIRAIHRIGKHALGDGWLWLITIVVGAMSLIGIPFWVTLPGAGVAYILLKGGKPVMALFFASGIALLGSLCLQSPGIGSLRPPETGIAMASAGGLFVAGLKAGLLTFGGAYTAIPFVRDDTVGRGWISEGQFLDSLALSGIIPAPLIIFATFIGFQAAGAAGALAITAGMFLPAFAFALLFYDQLEQLMMEQRIHRFLEAVTAGVIGLIATTTMHLSVGLAEKVPSLLAALAILAMSLAILYRWKSKFAIPVVVFGSATVGLAALA